MSQKGMSTSYLFNFIYLLLRDKLGMAYLSNTYIFSHDKYNKCKNNLIKIILNTKQYYKNQSKKYLMILEKSRELWRVIINRTN